MPPGWPLEQMGVWGHKEELAGVLGGLLGAQLLGRGTPTVRSPEGGR